MKIIKMGNLNKYRNTCPYCSCEYEYDDTDVSIGYELTSTGQIATVKCPCCGHVNNVVYHNIQPNRYYPYYDPITRYNNMTLVSTANLSEYQPHQLSDEDLSWMEENKDDENKD